MKKLLLALSLVLCSIIVYGQESKEVYCKLEARQKFMSQKIFITVDYGQETNAFQNDAMMNEETGKIKTFNSTIDALNYMGERGWKFIQAFVVTESNTNVYQFLMRKEVPKNP